MKQKSKKEKLQIKKADEINHMSQGWWNLHHHHKVAVLHLQVHLRLHQAVKAAEDVHEAGKIKKYHGSLAAEVKVVA